MGIISGKSDNGQYGQCGVNGDAHLPHSAQFAHIAHSAHHKQREKNSLSLLSFEQIGTVLNKLKRRKTLLNTGDNQKNMLK
jgi:hypothetical protein